MFDCREFVEGEHDAVLAVVLPCGVGNTRSGTADQPIIEQSVWAILRHAAGRHDILVHAIGGIDDHVHLAVSIPPKVSISSAIQKLKGASSREINRRLDSEFRFEWQRDFSILSFSDRDLESVQRYINNQRERHRLGTVRSALEPAGSPE